jgi:hypothetical protein
MTFLNVNSPRFEPVTLFNHERREEIDYLMEIKTGDLYRQEPQLSIAIKCGLIFCATPLYVFLVMSWYSCKLVADCTTLSKAAHDLKKIALAPLCGLGMQLAICRGLVCLDPHLARKEEAEMETFFWEGATYKDDVRMNDLNKGEVPKAFFLGWCFLKRGNIDDRKFTLLAKEEIPLRFFLPRAEIR